MLLVKRFSPPPLNQAIEQYKQLDQALSENLIPYWDFDAPGIPNTPRDASAAAITASSLLELSQYVSDAKGQTYQEAAQTIIRSLSGSEYRTEVGRKLELPAQTQRGQLPRKR